MAKSINISDADFALVVTAAIRAAARGDRESAAGLDKLARKMNAALSNKPRDPRMGTVPKLSWEDVPSVFEDITPDVLAAMR
jgi:hypothetical protein